VKHMNITIEPAACGGCRTCEVACKQEMNTPDGVRLIRVVEDGPHIFDGIPFFMYRINCCRHCQDPPCRDVCPDGAITRRSDGIVVLDAKRCSGCQACLGSCPDDAIDFDMRRGVAHKCNLCYHRVDRGLLPVCADNVCPAHCIHFNERA